MKYNGGSRSDWHVHGKSTIIFISIGKNRRPSGKIVCTEPQGTKWLDIDPQIIQRFHRLALLGMRSSLG